MDFLKGHMLLRRDKEVLADKALKKANLILYYFTGDNCYACRNFDPKLINVYTEAEVRKMEFAVIVVCLDPEKECFSETKEVYHDWYVLPPESDLASILMFNYGVTHIPTLIVVKKNGEIVTREGRSDIEKIGVNVLVTWL